MARHNYNDSRHYYDWLDRAGEDILSARLLLDNDECYQSSAFHCQQTVEKSLKAYILLMTGQLKDGHNLPWLCKQAMRFESDFSQWLDECAVLNRCYIETRYPTDIPLNLEYKNVLGFYKMAHDIYIYICGEVDEALDEGNAKKN